MNAHHIVQLLLRAALVLVWTKVSAEPAAIPDAPVRVEICADARVVCATIKTERVDKSLDRKGYRWGGEDVARPATLVSQLTVVVGGQEVFVPLSAFADLGNPRSVDVRMKRRGFDLVIMGGDASASYRALLAFDVHTLVRRKVQHGEFPNEAWEETRYRFNQLRN